MIKLLDPLTINQIAAGEVVERPASVVKELVENSIDAGATVITVEISKGGVELIKIIDNGSGFQLDEIEIAFLKHSTSKISTTSDLEHVLTMGFRGEALSSISSIAKVELTSKNKDSATGRRVTVSGGTITNTMDVAASQGTTFVIQDLFFNVPARKAFLKSAGVEAGRITDIIYKLALSHPNIAFKYIKDSKPIFQTRGNNNLKEVIFNIFGKEISDGTIPIQYATKDFKLEGRIGKLTLSKSNRSWELFFINGRYITNKIFNEAVEEAYKTLTMAKKFPVAILRVTMPASHLDVNVHPAKLEVRFKDSDAIKTAIINAIKQTLSEINLMPTFAEALPKSAHKKPALNIDQAKLVTPAITVDALSNELKFNNLFRKKPTLIVPEAAHVNATHEAAHVNATHGAAHSNATHGAAHVNATSEAAHVNATHGAAHSNATHGAAHVNANARSVDYTALVKNTFEYVADSADAAYTVTAAPKNTVAIPQEGLDYFLLGQIFETYWMIKYMDKVLIMDQHAAHERVIYEKLLAEFHSNTVDSQQLLCPMIFRPTANTLPLIAAHFALLEKAGFEIEMLNEITMIIRGVPFLFNQPMAQSQVKSFLEDFGNNKGISLPEEKIIRMACKAAIKGNHKISKAECKNLVESLLVLENPFSCPHGRPTLISLEKSDIEKLFRRIV